MQPADGGARRTMLGECLTLGALGLSVVSGALPWVAASPDALVTGLPGALYVGARHATLTGFALRMGSARVGWLILAAATVAALALLLPATGSRSAMARQVQTGAGIAVIGIALLHFGRFPGVFVAILCGIALVIGAVARYG